MKTEQSLRINKDPQQLFSSLLSPEALVNLPKVVAKTVELCELMLSVLMWMIAKKGKYLNLNI